MNRVITLLLLAGICVSTFFGGCKKSVTSNNDYKMNAKIGTEDYSAPNCMAVLTGTTMVIEGLSGSEPFPTYPYLAISLPKWYGATGLYQLDSALGHPNGRYFLDAGTYKISMYGNLNITSVTPDLIAGSFYFTTKDTVEIKEGTFTAKIFK